MGIDVWIEPNDGLQTSLESRLRRPYIHTKEPKSRQEVLIHRVEFSGAIHDAFCLSGNPVLPKNSNCDLVVI